MLPCFGRAGCRRLTAPRALGDFAHLSFSFSEEKKEEKMPAGRRRSQAVIRHASFFLLSSSSSPPKKHIPPELPRCPGAPSPRRRPSLAIWGRCRGGGAPGPLVSSRAEAEALLPSLLFSTFFLVQTRSRRVPPHFPPQSPRLAGVDSPQVAPVQADEPRELATSTRPRSGGLQWRRDAGKVAAMLPEAHVDD